MSLYCYMITCFDYSDTEVALLFHEQRYSKKEFQDICHQISKLTTYDVFNFEYLSDFINIATTQFGFKQINYNSYDILSKEVK